MDQAAASRIQSTGVSHFQDLPHTASLTNVHQDRGGDKGFGGRAQAAAAGHANVAAAQALGGQGVSGSSGGKGGSGQGGK